jgi:hypothetical protein
MAFAQAVADPLLSWILGTPMPAPPTMLAMSLHTQSGVSAANEVSGQVGGRKQVDPAWFSSPRPATGVDAREIANVQAIVFGNAQTALSITSWGLWSGLTGGTLLFAGDVIPDIQLRAGDPAIFSPGDVIIRIGQAILPGAITPSPTPILVP